MKLVMCRMEWENNKQWQVDQLRMTENSPLTALCFIPPLASATLTSRATSYFPKTAWLMTFTFSETISDSTWPRNYNLQYIASTVNTRLSMSGCNTLPAKDMVESSILQYHNSDMMMVMYLLIDDPLTAYISNTSPHGSWEGTFLSYYLYNVA